MAAELVINGCRIDTMGDPSQVLDDCIKLRRDWGVDVLGRVDVSDAFLLAQSRAGGEVHRRLLAAGFLFCWLRAASFQRPLASPQPQPQCARMKPRAAQTEHLAGCHGAGGGQRRWAQAALRRAARRRAPEAQKRLDEQLGGAHSGARLRTAGPARAQRGPMPEARPPPPSARPPRSRRDSCTTPPSTPGPA
jgi:hypothetical protein